MVSGLIPLTAQCAHCFSVMVISRLKSFPFPLLPCQNLLWAVKPRPLGFSPDSSSATGSGATGDAETVSGDPSATPQTGERRDRQPRVTIIGRLGADPRHEES